MSTDDRKTPAPPAVTLKTAETDVLAPVETTPPSLVEPEMLVKGFRYLQQRIPGFTQLTVQEKRSRARAANLDPEFIELGLHTACVWGETKRFVRRSGEELREEQEEIGRWDEAIRELKALIEGMEAANLKRKHLLGTAILLIYRMLSIYLERGNRPEDAYLRPYFENTKRAYLKTQQFRRKKKEARPKE